MNEPLVVWDLERMKKAVNSRTVVIPRGLSAEQVREFIINSEFPKEENENVDSDPDTSV